MKIYFAGSIRGGRNDVNLYKKIIKHISSHGTVLTEHVGNEGLSTKGEENNHNKFIFDRDMNWLIAADIIIAEVSTPSLGVGYELGISHKLNKPVLCLYKKQKELRLSAMINGNNAFYCSFYNNFSEVKSIIDSFILKQKNNLFIINNK